MRGKYQTGDHSTRHLPFPASGMPTTPHRCERCRKGKRSCKRSDPNRPCQRCVRLGQTCIPFRDKDPSSAKSSLQRLRVRPNVRDANSSTRTLPFVTLSTGDPSSLAPELLGQNESVPGQLSSSMRIFPSPQKSMTQTRNFDAISSHIHQRIIGLFGNPSSYLNAKAGPQFAAAVSRVFSELIPMVASEVFLTHLIY